MIPKLNSAKASQVAWAQSQAMIEFKDAKKAKKAAEAYGYCIDYARSLPKGWNINDTHEEFVARMQGHVEQKMQPSGFLGITLGWLFLAVLSGLISWAIRRFMDNNFPPKKT